MKIISMNIRGFGGLVKRKALKTLFSSLNPDMILIQETMCDHFYALHFFSKMNPGWEFCALDSNGLSGGLLTGWNPHTVRCKAYHSYAGILIKAKLKGLDMIFSILTAMDRSPTYPFFVIMCLLVASLTSPT